MIKIHVEGMMCMHCVSHVQKALEAVEGVKSVKVSLEDKEALVEALDGVDANTLVKAIVDAGYEASL